MNDRLKVKVWDKIKKEYVKEKKYCISEGVLFYRQGREIEKALDKRAIILQCTGLKDKNGKLIYEGDRIRMTDTLGAIFEGKIIRNKFNEIIFEEEQGGEYYLSNCLRIKKPKNTIEIIGNIYKSKSNKQ